MKNEPAFPSNVHPSNKDVIISGMTLRDYLAAKAMQGILATYGFENGTTERCAKLSYQQADAMLAERSKK